MKVKKIFLSTVLILLLIVTIFPVAFAEEVEYVYLGGNPIGIVLEEEGLLICGKNEVVTDSGAQIPSLDLNILPGDHLISINSEPVNTISDLARALKKVKQEEEVVLGIKRGQEIIYFNLLPAVESLTRNKKLGLIIQEGVSGIGTVTYVRKNGRFGALGHSIGDSSNKIQIGKIFDCRIIDLKLPKHGEAGELRGIFDKKGASIGTLDKNNDFGIFGKTNSTSFDMIEVRLGNRNIVKEGNASIYTCIDGEKPQKYEIEIVKVNTQNKPGTKSMVIKVTDSRLLQETGGILQGMSGSPIVQNGYLVGAVTHVFTSDSTKGYGIFVDWMINN